MGFLLGFGLLWGGLCVNRCPFFLLDYRPVCLLLSIRRTKVNKGLDVSPTKLLTLTLHDPLSKHQNEEYFCFYGRLVPIMLLNLPIIYMLFGNALIFPLLCFNFFLLCYVMPGV